MSQLIQSKIETVRRKHAAVSGAFGASTMLIVVVSVLAGTMLVDWLFDLPYLLRCAMLAIHVSALLYLLGRHVLWPLLKGPDDETVALWIEAFYQDAASRIISAVQFTRPEFALAGESRQMVGAAIHEAESYIQPKDTAEVVAIKQLVKRFVIAACMFVVFAGLFLWGGQNARDLLLRAVAVPNIDVPRNTRVELLTKPDRIVAKGDSIRIEAKAHGVIPSEGTLRVKYAGGSTGEFAMKPDRDEPEKFTIDIENVQDSFQYRVQLNDGRSPNAEIQAHARPAVTDVKIIQHLPAYTKRPPSERRSSDLQLLAGSRLQFRVVASKPLKNTIAVGEARNRIKFEGANVVQYLQRDETDPKVLLSGTNAGRAIPIPPGTTGISIHLVDELGLESKDSAVYRVDLVPDTAPRVSITYPTTREELLTERAATTVGFELQDDFGIVGSRIRYMPAGADATLEGDGLAGQYFNNKDLEGEPAMQRVDPKIDFALNAEQSITPQLPKDNFSIRWTGKLNPPQTGVYTFVVQCDDGVRMYVGEQLVLDQWGPRSGDFRTDPVQLEAGKMVDLRFEYQEITQDARCKLIWVRPDRKREAVPTSVFFSGDEAIRLAREKRTKSIELEIGKNQPTALRGQYKWDLAQLKLQPGDVIEWWVEAEDGNDQTGPGRGESDHRTLKIGTEAQVREAILARLGTVEQQIEGVEAAQEENRERLGEVIFEKSGTKKQDESQRP